MRLEIRDAPQFYIHQEGTVAFSEHEMGLVILPSIARYGDTSLRFARPAVWS